MRKIGIWAIVLIGLFIISTLILFIIQKITYEVHGPVHIHESKHFTVKNIQFDLQMIEASEIHDYLVTQVEIINKSNINLKDLKLTIRFDDELQKYAPVLMSEFSNLSLSGIINDKNDKSNVAIFTSDTLITKFSLLTEQDILEINDLIHLTTFELTWHSGKEILFISEGDVTKQLSLDNLDEAR